MSSATAFTVSLALKGAFLFLGGLGIARALRRSAADLRHRVWLVTFAGVLLLPVLMATLPGWKVLPAPPGAAGGESEAEIAPAFQANGELGSGTESVAPWVAWPPLQDEVGGTSAAGGDSEVPASSGFSTSPLHGLLLGAWLMGVTLVLVRSGWGLVALRGLRRRAELLKDPERLRELTATEEEAVDEAVVRAGIPREVYGSHLLQVARALQACPSRRMAAVLLGEGRSLEARLRTLLRSEGIPAPPSRALASGLVLLLVLSVVGTAAVESGSPDLGVPQEPVAISVEPILRVGVTEGDPDQEFHRVIIPFRLPDGRLAVPLHGDSEIRVFGPDGTFLERLGRAGEGPGEFASLSQAWSRGDTIEAMDGSLRRITRFLPDGSTQVVTLAEAVGVQGSVPEPLSDGWVTTGVASGGVGERDEIVVHRFGRDGSHLQEIARVPGMERVRYPSGGTGPPPLSPRALIEVRNDRIYVAETLTPEIQVFDTSGTLERTVTWEPEPLPSPAEALRQVRELAEAEPEYVRRTPSPLVEGSLALPPPERLSVFGDFLVDPEGYVWIRAFDPTRHAQVLGGSGSPSYLWGGSGAGDVWRVLAPDGSEVGPIQIPDALELLRVDSDIVIGVRRDEFGVESVQVHRLQRR